MFWRFFTLSASAPAGTFWGSLSAALENIEAPKGACQCQNIKHAKASGHQAPVRTLPPPLSRKFRISYCSQAEQKKEKVSPPGVRVSYASFTVLHCPAFHFCTAAPPMNALAASSSAVPLLRYIQPEQPNNLFHL